MHGADLFAEAMTKLAAGEPTQARRLLKRAAELQHLPALAMYAHFVEHGVGGKPTPIRALKWFERAAAHGDVASAIRLADWYLEHRDQGKAMFWLSQDYHNPHIALRRAKLCSKSRSARATAKARGALSTVWMGKHQVSDEECHEYEALGADYRKRTPDPSFSPNNQRRFAELQRLGVPIVPPKPTRG